MATNGSIPLTTVPLGGDLEAAQSGPAATTGQQSGTPSDQRDQENNDWDPVPDLPTGYPKLAGYFDCIPNAASFRRFGGLNMRKLIYLQADLCHLEYDLMQIEREDADCTDNNKRNQYARDWDAFKASARAQGVAGLELRRQWELMMNSINPKLKEYSQYSLVPFFDTYRST